MTKLLLILGLLVLAFGLRSYHPRIFQQLSGLCFAAITACLAYWFIAPHWAAALAGASIWLFLPWLDILFRIRNLRLPRQQKFRASFPPSAQRFPEMAELHHDLEEIGYTHREDTCWTQMELKHTARLYTHQDKRWQATLHLCEHPNFILTYLSLSAKSQDQGRFTTTNCPFSATLSLPEHHHLQHALGAPDLEGLEESHAKLLAKHQHADIDTLLDPDPETLADSFADDLHAQIEHNLHLGLIKETDEAPKLPQDDLLEDEAPATLQNPETPESYIRYTWKGYFFLWFSFLKHLFRA